MRKFSLDGFYMGRLDSGKDLLESVTDIAREQDIDSGYVWVLGTLRKAVLGFYDQQKKEYDALHYDEALEIVTCHGNISIKNGDVALHLHMTVGDETGEVYGGHVMSGNEIVVAEYCIAEFSGTPLVREHIESLNLDLWPISDL